MSYEIRDCLNGSRRRLTNVSTVNHARHVTGQSDPIKPPKGKAIVTMKGSRSVIMKLPAAGKPRPEWQTDPRGSRTEKKA